jgi:hypothetical protein
VSTNGAAGAAEPVNAPGDLNGLEASLKAAAKEAKDAAKGGKPSPQAPTGQTVQTQSRPEYIPEKFWTGNEQESLTKMAGAYSNLESAYGRMANDLGVQRKLTDRLLALDKRDSDLGNRPAPAPRVDPKRLVDNPTETLDNYWKEREKSLRDEWEAEQQKMTAAAREQAFVTRHPDYATTAQSPEFLAYANGDPFRAAAAAQAAQGDLAAADQLLTQFKAHRQSNTSTQGSNPNLEAARRAGTESAANASEQGRQTSGSKRIYRRADLIQLKMDKPHVYEDPSFQAEIYAAYQEGRVK